MAIRIKSLSIMSDDENIWISAEHAACLVGVSIDAVLDAVDHDLVRFKIDDFKNIVIKKSDLSALMPS